MKRRAKANSRNPDTEADRRDSRTSSDASATRRGDRGNAHLKCLGVRWLVGGDGNANARVAVAYREAGSETWRQALDLFRVETAAIREPNRPPHGQTLFAGSIFDLKEDTEYEVRLSLQDPDGGDAERILRMKTWASRNSRPRPPTVDVYPGQLAAGIAQARPGQVLRLHTGTIREHFARQAVGRAANRYRGCRRRRGNPRRPGRQAM